MPTRAVATEPGPVLWVPPGTIVGWPSVQGRPVSDVEAAERYKRAWDIVERPWAGDGILIVGVPGRAHSIWLFWESGVFAGWYVNLEDRWRPTRLGFDTQDHELDIWVESDGSWRWKDEDHLELAVDAGVFSPEEAAAFRAEGERVLAEWPFPTGWEDWRADPSWPVPTAPTDWATHDEPSSDAPL
jgi:uncharacterized protein